ncbi:tectonic-3-like [Osmerus mordax]|uniref:tectonic-3-like n=1 Tax=Osmerus mordax TaxID=8014 RepID=UPI003510D0E8
MHSPSLVNRMTTHNLCCIVKLVVALSVHLAHAATDASVSTEPPATTDNQTPGSFSPYNPTPGPFSPTTGGPAAFTSVSPSAFEPTDTAVTQQAVSTATTDVTPSIGTTVRVTESLPPPTSEPIVMPTACLCDLTPAFCDLGCCCDVLDCGVPDLRTVFTGCDEKVISGDCVEKWLMFRANVDPSFITVTNTLFCVQLVQDNTTAPQSVPVPSQKPAVLDAFTWQPPAHSSLLTKHFYRVDDVILSQYDGSSARSLLRQPSPGSASSACVDHNPARFLRSESLSCSRTLTPQSCSSDPRLHARSYFTSLSLVKAPLPDSVGVSDSLIPVVPLSDWPEPGEQNGSCLNVVSEVEYVIWFSGRGQLVEAKVTVVLVNSSSDGSLMQTHAVRYELDTPPPNPEPRPPVGLPVGSPVIGQFGEAVQTLTVQGVSPGGGCSSDPALRTPILFTHNTFTGCFFSSPSRACSVLRGQLYGLLQGLASPDLVVMNFGPEPDWARVITQACPQAPEGESCETGCLLPHSLSVQLLWARLGLLALPQSYILGARYQFSCQQLQCPLLSPLAVTTEVTFVDITAYPEPPRGRSQPEWKFPFGFFSRGWEELDGHTLDSAGVRGAAWSRAGAMLTLLVALHMLTR